MKFPDASFSMPARPTLARFRLHCQKKRCRAVPCQLTFVKWFSTARFGTARHGKTRVYTDETSGAVSCRAVLTRFLAIVNPVLVAVVVETYRVFGPEACEFLHKLGCHFARVFV